MSMLGLSLKCFCWQLVFAVYVHQHNFLVGFHLNEVHLAAAPATRSAIIENDGVEATEQHMSRSKGGRKMAVAIPCVSQDGSGCVSHFPFGTLTIRYGIWPIYR